MIKRRETVTEISPWNRKWLPKLPVNYTVLKTTNSKIINILDKDGKEIRFLLI